MLNSSQHDEALRLLKGLEDGTLDTTTAYNIIAKQDAVLVYFIFRYLREKHKKVSEISSGVLQRLVELTQSYEVVVEICQEGERDLMREWFDDTYKMKNYFSDPEGFLELIIDKLEG